MAIISVILLCSVSMAGAIAVDRHFFRKALNPADLKPQEPESETDAAQEGGQ
jgi:hypothetical protein